MDRDRFNRDGFLLLKDVLPKEEITAVLHEAQDVFLRQTDLREWERSERPGPVELVDLMTRLFNDSLQTFINCGKHANHLISLHRLALDERIVSLVRGVGLTSPSICTRPVLYFNHPRLAKKEVYWRVFPHQDWRSMQGSLDAVVVWLPLVEMNRDLGALEVIRGSHMWGLMAEHMEDGFGRVIPKEPDLFESVECGPGDLLLFSSFLVHQSGTNVRDEIRWSCHFRYNNLDEETFAERGFPHPYVYQPQVELITPGFPNEAAVKALYLPSGS